MLNVTFLPGGAAEKAGLHSGDKIIEVSEFLILSNMFDLHSWKKAIYIFYNDIRCFCPRDLQDEMMSIWNEMITSIN